MPAPDGERLTALEVQYATRGQVIQELRTELKEIRALVYSINDKLASITYAQTSAATRMSETHEKLVHVSKVVEEITSEDEKQRFLLSVGAKAVIPGLIALGTLITTLYQFRYAIGDFFRKVFS